MRSRTTAKFTFTTPRARSSTLTIAATLVFLPCLLQADVAIQHTASLPAGVSWCSDSMISGLLSQVNAFRASNGLPALQSNPVAAADADLRAIQFAAYMATHSVGSPGFDPHAGYNSAAASLGYNLVTENLAYLTSDPAYIVSSLWQDSSHRAGMLSTSASVAGVSCVFYLATPYWTFEPGIVSAATAPSPGPVSSPAPAPVSTSIPAPSVLDTEEASFLTLINNYRAQNGAGPLQVSSALEASSRWMSNDMAAKNYFSHTDSLGRSPGGRLAAFGYPYYPWGENIAAGLPDAQGVLNQFATACDPDASGNCTYAHRNNMLNASFTVIGIARTYSASATYGWYWTTDFGGVTDATLTPPSGAQQQPSVSSFTASPATISSGQAATLSWNVANATQVSINNGIGLLTGSSVSVAPSQTTVYTLTATNAAGSATSQITVTVNVPSGDHQSPSVPMIVSITSPVGTEVDLLWSASADNVGVKAYSVFRNNVLLKSVTGNVTSWSDLTVTPGTTYSYTVSASDAAGNVSAPSAVAKITTASAPPNSCPAPATGAFTACYYPNITLSGTPALIRIDPILAFDWGTGSPSASVPAQNFSARWQGNFAFAQGVYTFTAITSDGMRIYLDGQAVLNSWHDQAPDMYVVQRSVAQGNHLVTVEFYEESGGATASLTWHKQ